MQTMLCKIADLLVEVSEAGDLISRCKGYECSEKGGADIFIRTDLFRNNVWDGIEGDDFIYLESGSCFHTQLLNFGGMLLHSSAVAYKGKAYLFSAPCGTGKSTHTQLWRQAFGDDARIINDDKPALRLIDDKWYAYGTPWCGKDGINLNEKVPLGGICFLKQEKENQIRRMNKGEAVQNVLSQTRHKFDSVKSMDQMLTLLDRLVRDIPVFEMGCLPNTDAALLSYSTMSKAAEEANL